MNTGATSSGKPAAAASTPNPSQSQAPCQHNLTTTTKCCAPCVPMTKFCLRHILEEQGQVLFRACGVATPADGPCETPVANLFPHATCVFYTKLKPCNISDGKFELKSSKVRSPDSNKKRDETRQQILKQETDVHDKPVTDLAAA